MTNTSGNIRVGAPTSIVISAYGVAEGSGVIVGATEGGAVLKPVKEYYLHEADQFISQTGATCIKESCTLEFTMAEMSQANLVYAFDYPTTALSSTTISWGGNATVTYRTVYVNGVALESGGTVKITLHKCILVGTTEFGMTKDGKSLLKVVVQVLQDTSKTANQQYGTIVYTSTDTTPPTVAMTSPAEDGTVAAGGTGTLTLTFTEATNAIDEGTLIYGNSDGATIFVNDVEDPAATSLVAGTISYNAGTKVLTFTPTSAWAAAGENYQIIITTGVRDTAGNYLANVFYGHFVSA